ncbi:isocitrate/isopropylmalate dehydrogenase family protein [Candidatus Woesearchaeota archaeon]|nr:isocitrate/isopropylmalate dehydrogenase family protein [Candidatus Woesearchaeota archaeon]
MKYKIAVFPGDGVGPELISEGVKVIEKAAELDKFEVELTKYPNGAEHYNETKEALNEKTLKEIKNSCNAIYCGTFDAIGGQKVSNLIRDYFGQFVSLRPVKLLPGIESPLAGKTHNEIDFVIIRENSEDMYIRVGGRAKNGKNRHQLEINSGALNARFGLNIETKVGEIAYQMGVLSRKGCEKVVRYAFEYAKRKNKSKLVSVDKANVMDCYSLWRESFDKIGKEHNGIEYGFELIDATVMNLIRQPEKYQIIAAPNMFGDILSDLGTIMQGGLLFAAQGNINPEGISMFEPVHGSAAKLKGQGIINPIATIWAAALMLDSLGQQKSSGLVLKAIESVLKDGRTRTQDLDGNNTTSEMGDAIVDKFVELHD